ncbi:hypothetical protein OG203_08580 [Nocardia sp. NBC_01499]
MELPDLRYVTQTGGRAATMTIAELDRIRHGGKRFGRTLDTSTLPPSC